MLREIAGVRQDRPGVRRRWFQDDYLDLFVWTDASGGVVAFQLAYERNGDEHLLEWERSRGYLHRRVDDSRGGDFGIRGAALLTAGKRFPKYRVLTQFDARSTTLEAALRSLVRRKLIGYGNLKPRRRRRPLHAHRL